LRRTAGEEFSPVEGFPISREALGKLTVGLARTNLAKKEVDDHDKIC
jgi:hypothetical protein